MSELVELMHALKGLGPWGQTILLLLVLTGLAGLSVKHLQGQAALARGQHQIATNHLHDLPEMMAAITRLEQTIQQAIAEHRTIQTQQTMTLTKIAVMLEQQHGGR
jgi:hypothetical protein